MIEQREVFKELRLLSGPTPQSFMAEWQVAPELPYLQGHFPGNPVFPAVGILDASVYALSERIPSTRLHAVLNAKFLNLVQPGRKLRLEFTADAQLVGVWDVEWFEAGSDKALASLRVQMGPNL